MLMRDSLETPGMGKSPEVVRRHSFFPPTPMGFVGNTSSRRAWSGRTTAIFIIILYDIKLYELICFWSIEKMYMNQMV